MAAPEASSVPWGGEEEGEKFASAQDLLLWAIFLSLRDHARLGMLALRASGQTKFPQRVEKIKPTLVGLLLGCSSKKKDGG